MKLTKFAQDYAPPFVQRWLGQLEVTPIGDRLARGAFWSLVSSVFSRGSALLSSILVARMIGREGLGEFGIIQSTVGMFGIFATSGVGLTATRYVAEYRSTDPHRAGSFIVSSCAIAAILGGVVSTITFALAPILSQRMLAAPHLSGLLQMGAVYLFLTCLGAAQTGALSGLEAFKTIARINLQVGSAGLFLIALGAFIFGLPGAFWGLIATAGINWLLCHLAIREEAVKANVPLPSRGWKWEWKALWVFGLPAVLATAMVAPVIWITNAMLVNRPNGYAEMGIYNAANQWRNLILFLPTILVQANLPIMTESVSKKGFGAARAQLRLSTFFNLATTGPLTGLLCLLSPVIAGLYGAEFRGAWPVFVVAMGSAFFQAIQSPIVTLWSARNQMWKNFFMNIGWGISVLCLSWWFIDRLAFGLMLALLVSFVLYGIGMLCVEHRAFTTAGDV